MTSITDWLMIIITLIYVIATIIICWVNWRSVQTVEKQIKESRQQFEENQRLSKIPYLSCEIGEWIDREERGSLFPDMWIHVIGKGDYDNNNDETSGAGYSIILTNIGLGMADCIKCESVSGGMSAEHVMPFKFLQCGEEKRVSFIISAKKELLPNQYEQLNIVFYYQDLLSNKYKQEIEMEIAVKTGTVSILRYSTHSPIRINEDA